MRLIQVVRRSIGTVLMTTTTLSACTSWQVQPVTPEQVVTTGHPSSIRVERADGSRIVFAGPQISGDSLVGSVHGRPARLALADVTQVAVKHVNALKTAGLVFGIITVVFVALTAAYVVEAGY